MATLPTLDELLSIPEQQTVVDQEVLPELVSREVKVTSWGRKAVYRAMVYVVSRLHVIVRTAIAAIAAAGFEDYVFGFVAAPFGIDVTGWARLVAKQRYGLDLVEATHTRRLITLTNATATPYPNITAGGIIIQFPSGNRYVLDQDEDGEELDAGNPLTIPASDSVQAIFRSEFASDTVNGLLYNDASDSTIALVTANFPGVTATNPATDYSEVEQLGSGVGSVTPSGTPSGSHSVAVRIDSTGLAAAIEWSTSLDGATWESQSSGSVSDLGGTGINITLDDEGGSPAFVAGTFYYFSTPGSDIAELGRDAETPQELGARCRALWPLLAAVKDGAGNAIPISPTGSGYEFLARNASTQVKVVYVADGDVNNEVNVVIAGQGALLPSSVVATVQGYLDHFSMLTDLPVVSQPDTREITLGGLTITCHRGMVATAKAAVQRAIALYLGGVDTTEVLSINGKIEHGHIVSLIETAPGVKRLTDTTMTINGVIADLQLPVAAGAFELATWSQSAADDFTWAED